MISMRIEKCRHLAIAAAAMAACLNLFRAVPDHAIVWCGAKRTTPASPADSTAMAITH